MSREKQFEKDKLMRLAITAEKEWNELRNLYLDEKIDDIPNKTNYLVDKIIEAGYRKQSENTIELPCKVGDTVYRVKKQRGVWCILPREVVSITYRLDHLYRIVWEIFSTETDILGKTVFLTKEEAKEALAKKKGGE